MGSVFVSLSSYYMFMPGVDETITMHSLDTCTQLVLCRKLDVITLRNTALNPKPP